MQVKPGRTGRQIRAAVVAGIRSELVLADAYYGNDTDFRDGISAIGMP